MRCAQPISHQTPPCTTASSLDQQFMQAHHYLICNPTAGNTSTNCKKCRSIYLSVASIRLLASSSGSLRVPIRLPFANTPYRPPVLGAPSQSPILTQKKKHSCGCSAITTTIQRSTLPRSTHLSLSYKAYDSAARKSEKTILFAASFSACAGWSAIDTSS